MHLKVFLKLKKTLKTLSSGQIYKKTQKNPKTQKTQKNPLGWVFLLLKNPGFLQPCLGRLDAEVDEAVLVRHGQDDGLHQLLDLFVEAADVGVLLRGPGVHLHGLYKM